MRQGAAIWTVAFQGLLIILGASALEDETSLLQVLATVDSAPRAQPQQLPYADIRGFFDAWTKQQVSPEDESEDEKGPSGTAIGCSYQRWSLYSRGSLPFSWTDACFGSVTKGKKSPDAETVSKWKQAPCSCRDSGEPPKLDVKAQLAAEGTTSVAPLENYARTMAINHLLDKFLQDAPDAQVVLLGAGLDGRFYALPSLARASKLFEMDQEDTQDLKRALVLNCQLKPQSKGGVRYLPFDLSQDNVYNKLFQDESFDTKKPTIFVAEAVFQYVPESKVQKSLKFLADAMSGNPASRLIVQSYTGQSMVGLHVVHDLVRFGFPDNATARDTWYKELGLKVHKDSKVQSLLEDFQQQMSDLPTAWEMHKPGEYMDVLVPVTSA